MCLYPKLIINPKYRGNKKNNYNPPKLPDERIKYVPIGCGKCKQCMKSKANQWRIRLFEEIKHNKTGQFITLTFSNQSIKHLTKQINTDQYQGYELDNKIATIAVRRFFERVRKRTKTSIKHWLVTELGHNGTENIHLHGILFTKMQTQEIKKLWKYGFIWNGYDKNKTYINNQTINYITKYITKIDLKHSYYKPKIFCSPGIGKLYYNKSNNQLHKYNPKQTKENYTTKTGHKINMPIYYRNKFYTEKQREQLWIEKLDENVRYIGKRKFKMNNAKEINSFYKSLKQAQKDNERLGYGSDKIKWDEKKYQEEERNLRNSKRIQNAKN